MTLKLEWDGLLYGILTLTTIASITGLAARASKFLLPAPTNISQRDTHLDSRDVLADLITSWEIIPSLLKGDFAHPNFRSRGLPSAGSLRNRVILIFLSIAAITIATETALILSTGTVRSDLKIPDALNFTFIARHLVFDSEEALHPIVEVVDKKSNCISRGEVVFEGRRYVEYEESLCVRKTLKKNITMPNFVIRTERNSFDILGLWLGTVRKELNKPTGKQFDKTTYAIASASVSRRVSYTGRSERRILDKSTALTLAHLISQKSGCKMRDIRENGTLDNLRLDRPADIANFTCAQPLPTARILDVMAAAVVHGFGKYYYSAAPPRYRIRADAEVVRLQRLRKVGVQLSRAYEPACFALMALVSALGAAVWACDRLHSGAVYPSVGLLAVMSEIDHADEGCVNEIFRDPVALYQTERVRGNGFITTTFLKVDTPSANAPAAQNAAPASLDTMPDVPPLGVWGLQNAPPRPRQSAASPYPPSPVWDASRGIPEEFDNVVAAYRRNYNPGRRRDFFFRRGRDDRTREEGDFSW